MSFTSTGNAAGAKSPARHLKFKRVRLVPLRAQITTFQRDTLEAFATARGIALSEVVRRIFEDALDSWIGAGVIPNPHKQGSLER